ncbi:MAG TPA: HAMP domain-containing sensor histidine kinase [Chitinophagaceae bacterium]|nr:HAMP domain-containing sensor histidine kinase [Chitinophagaceae bacterium]
MKLFAKYNRVNLLATIVIFLFASLTYYIVLRYIFVRQVDGDLKIEQHEIETYAREHSDLPEPIPVKDQKITYRFSDGPLTKRKFSTTEFYDSLEKEKNPGRVLVFGIKVSSGSYEVTVTKSLERTDDLIHSVLWITGVTILLILLVSFLINRILLKRLWKPFYDTLGLVRNFRVDKDREINFPKNSIDEFTVMNETLGLATKQARNDYIILKEFTENASHEMQTPLAIIRSKLDLFIQHENLSEEQSNTMQSAYQAVEKLARLNQSLLLLAKIENNQYAEISAVDLRQKLEEKTEAFHELWQNQDISIETSLENEVVNMNHQLADILLNNLLSNATRHNFSGGFIYIELSHGQLSVKNSSKEDQLDESRIFSRFYKSKDKGSNGLGLSIIKQICDISGFTTRYSYEKDAHIFTVTFS